jgi:NAD(P)-dependent dehydrogenase (short-subunit alcohol dehydrogenase family)
MLGPIDICIANAGIVERGALIELAPEAWRRTLEVNLTGCFITAQAAARAMTEMSRKGHIVFISSWVQDTPRENIGAYCASKGGLKMLAKCLALELGPKRIRVNLVAPGWVDAGLTGKNLQAHPERRATIEDQIPLGRLASADEVARTVRLLCADEAAYVTGATLLLDGGSSLGYRK